MISIQITRIFQWLISINSYIPRIRRTHKQSTTRQYLKQYHLMQSMKKCTFYTFEWHTHMNTCRCIAGQYMCRANQNHRGQDVCICSVWYAMYECVCIQDLDIQNICIHASGYELLCLIIMTPWYSIGAYNVSHTLSVMSSMASACYRICKYPLALCQLSYNCLVW